MPEIVSCPDCDRKLRVPDNLLGKKVKCPGCGNTFTAETNGAAPGRGSAAIRREEDDEDDLPRGKRRREEDDDDEAPRKRRRDDEDEDDEPRSKRRRRDDEDEDDEPRGKRRRRDEDEEPEPSGTMGKATKEAWKKTRLGILLYVVGVFLAIGGFIIGLLMQGLMLIGFVSSIPAAIATGSGAASGFGYGMIIVGGLTMLISFGADVLVTLGMGFQLAIPSRRDDGLKGMAIATFVCYAVYFGCNTLAMVINLVQLGSVGLALFAGVGGAMGVGVGAAHMALAVVGGLAHLAALILAMFYYRLVALRFKQKETARSLLMNFISWCCYVAGSIVVGCLMAILAGTMLASMGVGVASGSTSVASANSTAGVMAYVGCALLVIVLGIAAGLSAWYGVLVNQVRMTVDRFIRRG
jgi:predicted Zn finger-like uncharacterized protein